MTLGWHTVLEFSPSLVGLMISRATHSFDLIRRSGECVINLPTVALADTVVRIGNCSGVSVDKYALFDLAPVRHPGCVRRCWGGVMPTSNAVCTKMRWWSATTSSSSRW